MINIFDNRVAGAVPLERIDNGDCFVYNGTLYRRLYKCFDDDIDVEFMYSGVRSMLHKKTAVVPVDVEIIFTEAEEICD